jgi:hypothetical protein
MPVVPDDDPKRRLGERNGVGRAASLQQTRSRVARCVLVQCRARSDDIAKGATNPGRDVGANDGDRVCEKQSLEPRR